MTKHKHYDLAYRAHYNTSFTPDKRAEDFCIHFDRGIASLKEIGVEQYKIDKYEALTVKWLTAKSRCISYMITGPANFPLRRAERANQVEHARSVEVTTYWDKIVKQAKEEAYYREHPESRPIMSNQEDAIELLKAKLEKLRKAQETMVAANKLVRKTPVDRAALLGLLGSEKAVEELLKPDFAGCIGFASYALSNNRANLKQVEQRIAEIEKRKATTPKEVVTNGVRVLENTEAMRLQLFFEGKPKPEIITLLKSKGFKWSPSAAAWQRQLTNNAIYSFKHFVLPAIKAQA